jgi:hypothetical protein
LAASSKRWHAKRGKHKQQPLADVIAEHVIPPVYIIPQQQEACHSKTKQRVVAPRVGTQYALSVPFVLELSALTSLAAKKAFIGNRCFLGMKPIFMCFGTRIAFAARGTTLKR